MVCIAMVGQVPIKVKGVVVRGQYIAAGLTFGEVRAFDAKDLSLLLYQRVVGIALESSTDTAERPISCLVFYPDVGWLARNSASELGECSMPLLFPYASC